VTRKVPDGGGRREESSVGVRRGCPKGSPGSAMPDPATPYGQVTPEPASQMFQGCPARKLGGLQLCSTPLDTRRRAPMETRKETRKEKNGFSDFHARDFVFSPRQNEARLRPHNGTQGRTGHGRSGGVTRACYTLIFYALQAVGLTAGLTTAQGLEVYRENFIF
jgi:hypothetical protein